MINGGTLPIALAVVGSVMTFAYSLKFLRVFVGPYRCHRPNVHEAPLWMLLPPALLSVLVVLFGVFPWDATLATPVVSLAAPALEFEVHALYLWHGLNQALILSFWTWGAGILLFALIGPFGRLQEALSPGWNANTVYYALMGGLERTARFATHRTQNAAFAAQLRLLWFPVALLGVGFAFAGLGAYLPTRLSPVPLEFLAAALLVVGGAYGSDRRPNTNFGADFFRIGRVVAGLAVRGAPRPRPRADAAFNRNRHGYLIRFGVSLPAQTDPLQALETRLALRRLTFRRGRVDGVRGAVSGANACRGTVAGIFS